MRRILLSALFLVHFPVSAAGLACSIRPAKDTPVAALPALAKISQSEAQKKALARVKSRSAEVVSAELEVEHDCLVYSFDIRRAGKSGIEEIMVDAGTGRIVSQKHETAIQEAAEKAKDKLTSRKAN